jgi:hypothetical protein
LSRLFHKIYGHVRQYPWAAAKALNSGTEHAAVKENAPKTLPDCAIHAIAEAFPLLPFKEKKRRRST